MKDIAQLAGVSQPTVSRVINNNPKVDPLIKERVLNIIKEYNFKPNQNAKTLRGNSSKIIGLIVFDFSNYYYLEMVKYAEKAAREKGYTIIVMNSEGNQSLELEHIMQLIARKVDGILIAPTSKENLKYLKNTTTPFLVINTIFKNYSSISTSLFDGGKIASDFLISLGHKKIAFIGADLKNPKFLGMKSSLEKNKIKMGKSSFIKTDTLNMKLDNIFYYLDSHPNEFTAFICSNDNIALYLISEFEKRGVKIPEDISVVGFDNTIISKILNISSIKQPMEEMMIKSIQLLTGSTSINNSIIQIELEPILIERKSTKKFKKNSP